MRFRVVLCLVLFVFAFLLPRSARAQLTTIETENLRLIYDEITLGYIAPHAARCFENALRFHRALFEYAEDDKVTVLLSDFGDTGNAGAGSTPRNIISILVAPVSFAFETYSANERINTLMNHELVHIVAVDMPHGSDRFFRGLFGGKVKEIPEHPETILFGYLTTPRDSAPRWFHEGIAVFLETWMAGGLGRALGAYDEMVFRSMVKDGTRFYDPLGLESEGTKTDFQAGVNSYLYGTRFMSYLAFTYSPEKLIEWTSRGSGSKKYYAANFKKTFGRSLSDVWREWVEWEHTFQKKNLAAIAEYPTTPYRDISDRGLGSVSRAHVDRDRGLLYAAVNYPGTVSHVAAISLADGSIEKLIDIKGSSLYTVTSLAFDPESGLLFYTTDNYEWRDLRCLDPETGDSRTLIDDVRVGDLVFNQMDRSLWGIRHYNGISTLTRIAYPWKDWDQVYSWPYGEGLYDLDLSPGGGLLSGSFTNIEGKQSLHVYAMVDLIEGIVEPIATTTFGTSVPSNFAFSPGGEYLYGSSYYTGVSNIFRYELATDSLNAVSNCETGFFRPIPLGADSLLVFRYTGEGFVPSRVELKPVFDVNAITFLGQQVVEEHPVVTSWTAGSPTQVNLDEIMTYKGPYRSVAGIRSESIYPIVGGYKDVPVYGLRMNLSDPLRMNKIGLDVAYSPDLRVPEKERTHISLGYERYNFGLRFQWNAADFYDLFGPTKRSRKGYSVGANYQRTLVSDDPRSLVLNLGTTAFWDLERLPDYQNVSTSSSRLVSSSASITYSNQRASIGAIDYEKGTRLELMAWNSVVRGEAFPAAVVNADGGVALPLGHSSVWLRNSAGYSPGERDEPYANFFFGGFGNNWVDDGRVKRYREFYSFPGLELNELGGTNYVKSTLELNLPPLRFRRLGTPGCHATWLRPALFAMGAVTNLDDGATRTEVLSAGTQLDLRLSLLSHLDLTFSIGYAAAFEKNRRHRDEFMFSLKVL